MKKVFSPLNGTFKVQGPYTDCFSFFFIFPFFARRILKYGTFLFPSLCPWYFFFTRPFPPFIHCSAISVSRCLLFFSCNRTRRFISVALRHHLNQFPASLPSWRGGRQGLAPRSLGHTFEHTHSNTHTHTSRLRHTLLFTHTVASAPPHIQKRTGTNTLRAVIHHITVL